MAERSETIPAGDPNHQSGQTEHSHGNLCSESKNNGNGPILTHSMDGWEGTRRVFSPGICWVIIWTFGCFGVRMFRQNKRAKEVWPNNNRGGGGGHHHPLSWQKSLFPQYLQQKLGKSFHWYGSMEIGSSAQNSPILSFSASQSATVVGLVDESYCWTWRRTWSEQNANGQFRGYLHRYIPDQPSLFIVRKMQFLAPPLAAKGI